MPNQSCSTRVGGVASASASESMAVMQVSMLHGLELIDKVFPYWDFDQVFQKGKTLQELHWVFRVQLTEKIFDR